MNHPQVHIEHGDIEADVDEKIAPLILEIWKAGIYTDLSCQSNHGKIWIAFTTTEDAKEFLDAVCPEHEEGLYSLYNRIAREWRPEDNEEEWEWEQKAWDYDVLVEDWNGLHPEDDSKRTEPPDFFFSISIRFPKSDYEAVLEKMVAHNKTRIMPQ